MTLRQQRLSSSFKISSSAKPNNRVKPNRLVTRTADNSNFSCCPLCQACLPIHVLLVHVETCTGKKEGPDKDKQAAIGKDGNITKALSLKRPQEDTNEKDVKRKKEEWWIKANRHVTLSNKIGFVNPPLSEPISGLHQFPNFITEQEEQQILAELDGEKNVQSYLSWKASRFNGHHQGKRWGVHCNLRDRKVTEAENLLPIFLSTIILPKLQQIKQMMGCIPNEANAIDYQRRKGDFLKDHVDDRQLSKEPIANLSIMGDCYMTFINQKKGHPNRIRVLLPRRTLQILTGKARYEYSHGIRNEDLLSDRRVSVTMRESPLSM
mmetsp:Transcript_24297/g.36012  ORF Transcript_24297/g.36012 Transcript_24297/m.36012 type:complete len:322 (-) Transcript_24297:1893-2858(-)